MKYLCMSLEDETVNGMINAKELERQFEQYANQRIIEELGRLRGIGITYTDDAIDKRIKELK